MKKDGIGKEKPVKSGEEKTMTNAKPNGQEGKKRQHRILHFITGVICLGLVLAVSIVSYNIYINNNFKEHFYQVSSGKISGGLRIIQISDLHNSEFGENNEELVERISELQPDIIAMTGDIIEENGQDYQTAVKLCEKLVNIAPVYFVYGNHETIKSFDSNDMSLEEIDELLGCDAGSRSPEGFWIMEDELKSALEAVGVHVLWNEYETVRVGDNQIDIYGVLTGHPYAFWEYAGDTYSAYYEENAGHFKLMLCHEPYIYETWHGDSWADLSLAGHTHGGLIRIPYIGGLYEYRNGLFPESGDKEFYVYGKYNVNGSPLIVSNGLNNQELLRINNQPELIIIDVNRY